jgi:hypothetical protein
MDKLKELLKSSGVSEALIEGICQEFERLDASIKEENEKRYKASIQRAEQVCLEEIDREKARLARRVKVYLESKARVFEDTAEKHRRIEESESAVRVRRAIDVLTDGTSPNVASEMNGQLADAKRTVERLEKALNSVREERNTALERADRAYTVAKKTLGKNQALEAKIRSLDLSEGELPDFLKKDKKEDKAEDKKDADDGSEDATDECMESKEQPKAKTLDESRKVKAKSRAKQPIAESNQAAKQAKPLVTESTDHVDPDIAEIVKSLPEIE